VDWDRLYEWQYLVVGVVGLALSAVMTGPGEHSVGVGPLSFDPFYFAAGCFTLLIGLSTYGLWKSRDGR
jgi:hypothetical protein